MKEEEPDIYVLSKNTIDLVAKALGIGLTYIEGESSRDHSRPNLNARITKMIDDNINIDIKTIKLAMEKLNYLDDEEEKQKGK